MLNCTWGIKCFQICIFWTHAKVLLPNLTFIFFYKINTPFFWRIIRNFYTFGYMRILFEAFPGLYYKTGAFQNGIWNKLCFRQLSSNVLRRNLYFYRILNRLIGIKSPGLDKKCW